MTAVTDRFAKGGVITGNGIPFAVKVKMSEGRAAYWERELNQWVPILTAAEAQELGKGALEAFRANLAAPEQELADDYERNEHQ